MKMNMDALKALELKLAEYTKENGAIAEHESGNKNGCNAANCSGSCFTSKCSGSCAVACVGGANDSERYLT